MAVHDTTVVDRPRTDTIPDAPGAYLFRDREGRAVYVGKAKSLRKRVVNYFADPRLLHPRTAAMVEAAASIEWIEVRNEVEALMLEYTLIKEHRPRFNIRLRDDKSYPYLAVTLSEEWPRAMVMRGKRRKGTRYYGPFAHAYAIRETLDLLLRTFPIRTCSPAKWNRYSRLGRPCLFYDIGRCAGPCCGLIGDDDYRGLVSDLCGFLDGDTAPVIRRLEEAMNQAATAQEYEQAARLRDQLASVRKAIERQQMVTSGSDDLDCIALAEDELEAAVQVFYVRRGRVTGRKGLIVDKVEELTTPELLARIIEDLYYDAEELPREVLVPTEPEDHRLLEEFLSGSRGTRVSIRVPQRGEKRVFLETVERNAKEQFTQHRLRRSADHNARARALRSLQDELALVEAPLRIECFDISTIQGTDKVASMVVMEDALPRRNEYRRFKIRHVQGQDDFASMDEALRRRFENYLTERDHPPERGRKFSYAPNLLIVDGGRGQLNVAVRVLEDLGLDDEIAVAGLAKRYEEVYLPDRPEPVRIARGSEALYLLQQVRDEAHRFAITYHRQLRGKRMTKSVFDDIPGVGEARRKALIRHFGSAKKVREASVDELKSVPGVGPRLAETVYEALHKAAVG
jgi:excinuclease ABC subunit C